MLSFFAKIIKKTLLTAYYNLFFSIFATMKNVTVRILTRSEELPEMHCNNFFHSTELFYISEKTPGIKPFMAIAEDERGQVVAHMLATIRTRGSWLPPYLYTHGRIYGEGEYEDEVNKEEVFGLMLKAVTRKLKRRLCLYTEFSDISQKMFGYRLFRSYGYFPVHWQEIHNSLHSKTPEERITDKMRQRIQKSYDAGVVTREVKDKDEVHAFYKLLNGFYRMKLRRFIPPEDQFNELDESNNAKIFITEYKNKIIGGCVCVYSEGNAYLWYLASKRKSFPALHPNMMTVWQAITYAHQHNYAHIFFLDVGLPFKKNPFREFILSFGGKPVAKYRWFRFSIPWINKLLSWWYSE
jgi:hypothetical protein